MNGTRRWMVLLLVVGWITTGIAEEPPAKARQESGQAYPDTRAVEVPAVLIKVLARIQEVRLARRELELRYGKNGREEQRKKFERVDKECKLVLFEAQGDFRDASKAEREMLQKLERQKTRLQAQVAKAAGKGKEASTAKAELDDLQAELELWRKQEWIYFDLHRYCKEVAQGLNMGGTHLLRATGGRLPHISFTRLGGAEPEKVDLITLAEKGPVAVAFWSLRNEGSQRTLAQMPGLIETFAADWLTVVAINVDEDATTDSITRQIGRAPPSLIVGQAINAPMTIRTRGLQLLPVVALINQGGIVNSVFIGNSAGLKVDIKTALDVEKVTPAAIVGKNPAADPAPAKGK